MIRPSPHRSEIPQIASLLSSNMVVPSNVQHAKKAEIGKAAHLFEFARSKLSYMLSSWQSIYAYSPLPSHESSSTMDTHSSRPTTQSTAYAQSATSSSDEDDMELSTLGYKRQMPRQFSVFGLMSLSFALTCTWVSEGVLTTAFPCPLALFCITLKNANGLRRGFDSDNSCIPLERYR